MDMKRFVKERRRLLKDEMKLIGDRNIINKKLRQIRDELYGWDKYLLNER